MLPSGSEGRRIIGCGVAGVTFNEPLELEDGDELLELELEKGDALLELEEGDELLELELEEDDELLDVDDDELFTFNVLFNKDKEPSSLGALVLTGILFVELSTGASVFFVRYRTRKPRAQKATSKIATRVFSAGVLKARGLDVKPLNRFVTGPIEKPTFCYLYQ